MLAEDDFPFVADDELVEARDSDNSDDGVFRPWCHKCLRAKSVCLCKSLPPDGPLDTKSRIAVLLHPKEQQRSLGTAPLLRLCLKNLVVAVHEKMPTPEEDPSLHDSLTTGGYRCMLVCPGPDAEVLELPEDGKEVCTDRPLTTLIFVDGTWPKAKAMVFQSPWLQQLPRVVLRPTARSGYFFRKQPESFCLSTLEAVAEALLVLEGTRGPAVKAALIAPFQMMVEHQVRFLEGQQDKNPEVEREQMPLFQADLALRGLPPVSCNTEAAEGQQVYCIARWGERSVDSRDYIVIKTLRCTEAEVKIEAKIASAGRSRGRRCWTLPIEKVPAGAFFKPDS
eukprot:gnl/TRDRNA2_/TRDRNA2_136375_c0_seq1.p1 gnl/TRDRNA2_/TRDRNA2_136375_c0~~gnl/TRDRNA2_/TRDRNA2_136375_c0_seq1.p1  ORF type:complete len:370 (+),score=71.11 gnl/TRDRNA2_/TRDRNA2_136375_c0_seq1:97-1110(+)